MYAIRSYYERGHLIGGLCRARKGVEVQNLGSANGARTQVSFGQDYLVKDAIEAEEREIERVKALILQTDKRMRDLEAAGENLDKVRQEKLRLVKLLEQRSLVITSYSIHYTKLYESRRMPCRGSRYGVSGY